MSPMVLVLRASARRLGGRARGWLATGGALVAVCGVSVRGSSPDASDVAVAHLALGVVLPLLALAWLRALVPSTLDEALAPWSRLGMSRRAVWLATGAVGILATAAAGMLLAVVGVVASRPTADPLLLPDLGASAWIGAAGGAGYFAWVALGARWARLGPGLMLALDWVLGAVGGAASAVVPRGTLRALATAQPILDLPLGACGPWLVGLGLVAWLVSLAGTSR